MFVINDDDKQKRLFQSFFRLFFRFFVDLFFLCKYLFVLLILEGNLMVYYQNVRGSKTKIYEFRTNLLTLFLYVWRCLELIFFRLISMMTDIRDVQERPWQFLYDGVAGWLQLIVNNKLISKRVYAFETETEVWVSVERIPYG